MDRLQVIQVSDVDFVRKQLLVLNNGLSQSSLLQNSQNMTHMEHDEGDYQNSFKQNIAAISSSFYDMT